MKFYFEMFLSFFKIGSFTIGGGYAMLPLIQEEIVHKKQWIAEEEFVNMLAAAQASPGPLAVNTSVFVGYKLRGIKGVFCTVLGCILPSFIIISMIAVFFSETRENEYINKMMKAIRPTVVALIASSAFTMGKAAKITMRSIWIPIVVAIMVAWLHVTPIILILCGAVGGLLYFSKKEGDTK